MRQTRWQVSKLIKCCLKALKPSSLQKPNTSKPHPQHKVYPYLLSGLTIDRPSQVWCADQLYSCAVRLSLPGGDNGLVQSQGLALAIVKYHGCRFLCLRARRGSSSPDIFNTDQGSQFTSDAPRVLKEARVRISMDGRGRDFTPVWATEPG